MEKTSKSGSEILHDISILNAVYWVSAAWKEVETSTIEKCFRKSGFKLACTDDEQITDATDDDGDSDDNDDDDDDDVPLQVIKLSRELFGCDFKDLPSLDANVYTFNTETTNWDQGAKLILDAIHEETDSNMDDDDDDENNQTNNKTISAGDFSDFLDKMKDYATTYGKSDILEHLMKIDEIFTEDSIKAQKQSDIRSFFK
ncbi:hypothetical protein FSP39_012591 [Pinctada imbricata]|uniref:DDE-1 domain-containing protein n=1 Tax=Pinctada imbricata TaxID=66713 RepID=A0AA89C9Z7_PINIB|nr:hypothetical protein FSP39_012591 [Pinctada imbricata]